MRPNKILAATAALSLLVSGSAAVAQSAQSLSVAGSAQRAGAPVADSSDLGGRRGLLGWVLGLIAIGMVIFVVTKLSKDNDLPASP